MLREMRASLKPIYKTEFGLITANKAAGILHSTQIYKSTSDSG